jgi:putative nucleotidyltransferase with HDIG domain
MMSNYYERSSPVKQNIVIVMLFVLASVLTISFFPTQGKFKYEYQKGTPWQHNDLMAPFDFAIYKSESELKANRDSLQENFKLYFNFNAEIGSEKLTQFINDYDIRFSNSLVEVHKLYPKMQLPDTLHRFVLGVSKDIISFIYDKGVVDFSEGKEEPSKSGNLVVVKNKLAENRDVEEVFTQKKAYEFINKRLKIDFATSPHLAALIENLKLYDYISQNLTYDEETTLKVKEEMIKALPTQRGMIHSGELIISRGDLVHDEKFLVLESFKKEYQTMLGSSIYLKWLYLGQIIVVLLAFAILYLFLYQFRREILGSLQKTLFILMMVLIMVVASSVVVKFNQISIYMIPFVALPIIIHSFYDSRLAFFIHMVTIMLIGFLAPNSFEFIFLQFLVGAVSIFSLAQMHRRGQLFAAVGFIVLTYIIGYTALGIMQEGDPFKINPYHYLWFVTNGLLLLICYPLIFIFEKIFGFISDVTLIELSDTNHPALRDLAEKAPGTFHHVIQVANLAEAASRKIGANPLLTRVGALYHDIGKTGAPGFFIENQVGKSAHDGLNYEKSAEMIIQHVHYGMELARKYKLPKVISDFIVTHHGTGLVKFFYTKYSNENEGVVPDISKFSYPGPAPFTKETAVLMMADAVEASSRSLKEYSESTISELVERIINHQIEDNQFEEAEITFKDIYQVKLVFKQKLMNMYHTRIEYPDMKKH